MKLNTFTRLAFFSAFVCLLQACPFTNEASPQPESKPPSSLKPPPEPPPASQVNKVFRGAQLFAKAKKSDTELKADFDSIKDDPTQLKTLSELKVPSADASLADKNFAQLLALGIASPVVLDMLQTTLKALTPAERVAMISSHKVAGLNAFDMEKQMPRPAAEKEEDRLQMLIAMLKEQGMLIKDLDIPTINKILILLPKAESSQMANNIGDPIRSQWIKAPETARAIKHYITALDAASRTRLKSELMREVYLQDPSDKILEFLDDYPKYGFSKDDIVDNDFKINDAADAHNILGFYAANRNLTKKKHRQKLKAIKDKLNKDALVDDPKAFAEAALAQTTKALGNDNSQSKILLGLPLNVEELFKFITNAVFKDENTDEAWDKLIAYYDGGGSFDDLNKQKDDILGYKVIHLLAQALNSEKALNALKRHIEEAKGQAALMLNEKVNDGDTPFIIAAKYSKLLDGFKLLMEKGAKPNGIGAGEILNLTSLDGEDGAIQTILQNLFQDLYQDSKEDLQAWLDQEIATNFSDFVFKKWYAALKKEQKLDMLELLLKSKGQHKDKKIRDSVIAMINIPRKFGIQVEELTHANFDDGTANKGNLLWAAFGFINDIDAEQIKQLAGALKPKIADWNTFVSAPGGDGTSAFDRALPYFNNDRIATKIALQMGLDADDLTTLITTLAKGATIKPLTTALATWKAEKERADAMLALVLKRISADELTLEQMSPVVEVLLKKGASLKDLSLELQQILAAMAQYPALKTLLSRDAFGPTGNASFLWSVVKSASPGSDNSQNFRTLAATLFTKLYSQNDAAWKTALERKYDGRSTLELVQQKSLNIPDMESAQNVLLYPIDSKEAETVARSLQKASPADKPKLFQKLFRYLALNPTFPPTKLGKENVLKLVASADASEDAFAALQTLLRSESVKSDKNAVHQAIDLASKSDDKAPKYWERLLLFIENDIDVGEKTLDNVIEHMTTTKNSDAIKMLIQRLLSKSAQEAWFKSLRQDPTPPGGVAAFKDLYEAAGSDKTPLLIKLFKDADVNEALKIMQQHEDYGMSYAEREHFIEDHFNLLQALNNSGVQSVEHEVMRDLVAVLRSSTKYKPLAQWRAYIEGLTDVIKIWGTIANPQLPYNQAASMLNYKID